MRERIGDLVISGGDDEPNSNGVYPAPPVVRVADHRDGETIRNLLSSNGYAGVDDLDWRNVGQHWLVYEEEDFILGAVLICPGLPIAVIEFMAVEENLPHRKRADVVKGLVMHAMASCRGYGAQMVTFIVPHHLKAYKKVLKRRGAVTTASGSCLVKRVA